MLHVGTYEVIYRGQVVFNVGYVNKTHKISHKLREEMKHHGDLIVGDVKESFYTLSKKLSIGIDWLHRNLVFDFVLKTDDDVFINIPKVLKALNTLPSHIQYFGHVMWRQPVERKGRYKLTPDEFKHDRFDPYCSGGGFIVRQGVIEKIAWYLVFNRPLKYEDAYFGSLAFKAGVVPSKAYDKYFLMRNHKCIYHGRDVSIAQEWTLGV
ncbi:lactosylceramide 1,3-N-acetyl-beta-D-glucosaminyltransferase A-like [Clytia hemisphaerica]|uniref:Hexosyltransferase n=1 Tax=Clytia hemisphaerica TaxID=252671 RepID=A0A7M5X0X1_9CNID